ncbi:ferritin-like domain-containing protein [Russula compacta]|nr:ferritin-like domain-containing protein [Russula compacta]
MRYSTKSFLAAVLAPLVVSAVPLRRGTDPATLQVLPRDAILQPGADKFKASDFISAGFMSPDAAVEQITTIQSDEAAHVTAIQGIITGFGEKPLAGCKFDFSSALTDVETMLKIARVVEHVGVGAYLGAAHLVQDPVVLTSAASILTIEARHQTLLNIFSEGTAIPQSFDIPLLPQEVLAIAGSFVSGCDLGITANAALSVTNTGSITVGTSLQFKSSALNSSTSGFHCQMLPGGAPFSIALPIDQCVVPAGINGPVAIYITSDDQPLNGNAVERQSNALIAGPLLTFIDVKVDKIDTLVRNSKGMNSKYMNDKGMMNKSMTAPPPSATTITILPAQASALISTISLSASQSSSSSAASSAPTTSTTIVPGLSMVPAPSQMMKARNIHE